MIESILQFLINLLTRWQNRESLKTFGAARSGEWNRVRDEYLKEHPKCEVCGGTEGLQVHHKLPFNIHPEYELLKSNLITLCEKSGRNHHLIFGHLGSFRSWNVDVAEDSKIWYNKISNRPEKVAVK